MWTGLEISEFHILENLVFALFGGGQNSFGAAAAGHVLRELGFYSLRDTPEEEPMAP